jgi:DHA2 family multidrug resistance protein
MLAIGIGALQLMLDRGGEVEWFAAFEIWLYAFLAISGIWIFGVHIRTTDDPFLDPRIFADRNFLTGLVFIFVIGIVLLASLALLPPMLAHIYGYPTITTGLVMAPRGVGTMVSMIVVGRLVRRIDARLLVVTGLLLTTVSLHMMTGFTPQMDDRPIIVSGVVQGLGLGLVFVPLSTVAFATLAPKYRADATSLFSLVRNIGSSIGISVVSLMLSRNIQVNHVEIGSLMTPFNPTLRALAPGAAAGNVTLLSHLDGLVNQQVLMISYIDDFKLMMIVTMLAIPLAFLLRRPTEGAAPVARTE